MEELLKKFMEQMNNRFDQVDQRFEKIDQRFDRMDQRFEKMDQRFDRMDQRFEKMDQRLDRMDQRFEKMDQRFDRMDQRMEGLEKDVKELKIGQNQLKDNLIHGLGPYFEQIEKHIDEKTDGIRETIKGQQNVIDTLSARSIKHESELKEFKRMIKNQ
ncbi:hypothetical protein D3H55_15200 [Bacillus salacetis]|uniref:t-SNARE coiled-coil homology domain-containing protein n=1 Tax=Bacillus salacetis TaxID=2315464 RepID=A0A3A1QWP7_9BACI|nr:hypothetical protein [Bacillus salacetis]RIW31320.1 hypothetical protein D3H55_15200 [Bacillus salacetis]